MTIPRRVEFLGTTGSGKSTLIPTALEAIPDARKAKEAYIDSITGEYMSLVTPVLFLLPGRIERNVIRSYARFQNIPVYAYHDLSNEHPDFAVTIEHVMEQADVDKRESIRRLLVRRAVRYGVLMDENRPIVFDEGFAMGAVSLFARRREPVDRRLICQYMDAVPWPDVIIKVTADVDRCYNRVQARSGGFPGRMEDLSPEKRYARITDMEQCVTVVGDLAEQRGTTVIELDNTDALSVTKDSLERKLTGLCRRSSTVEAHTEGT
jgi:hypothetical protein